MSVLKELKDWFTLDNKLLFIRVTDGFYDVFSTPGGKDVGLRVGEVFKSAEGWRYALNCNGMPKRTQTEAESNATITEGPYTDLEVAFNSLDYRFQNRPRK